MTDKTMTAFEVKVFGLVQRAGQWHSDDSDGAHIRRALRSLEAKGHLTSELEDFGTARTYRPATQTDTAKAAQIVSDMRAHDSERSKLFNEIVARRTPWNSKESE